MKAQKCHLCGFELADPVVTIIVTLPGSATSDTRHFCCVNHFMHWMKPMIEEAPRDQGGNNPFRFR